MNHVPIVVVESCWQPQVALEEQRGCLNKPIHEPQTVQFPSSAVRSDCRRNRCDLQVLVTWYRLAWSSSNNAICRYRLARTISATIRDHRTRRRFSYKRSD